MALKTIHMLTTVDFISPPQTKLSNSRCVYPTTHMISPSFNIVVSIIKLLILVPQFLQLPDSMTFGPSTILWPVYWLSLCWDELAQVHTIKSTKSVSHAAFSISVDTNPVYIGQNPWSHPELSFLSYPISNPLGNPVGPTLNNFQNPNSHHYFCHPWSELPSSLNWTAMMTSFLIFLPSPTPSRIYSQMIAKVILGFRSLDSSAQKSVRFSCRAQSLLWPTSLCHI